MQDVLELEMLEVISVIFFFFFFNLQNIYLPKLYFCEKKSLVAIDGLELKSLDISPLEESLSNPVFKLLLPLFQPSK